MEQTWNSFGTAWEHIWNALNLDLEYLDFGSGTLGTV